MVKQGATIIAHDNVRKRLKDYIDNSDKKVDEKILPDVTFNEGINFYFNGERIAVYYLSNAHTDGDAVVHFTESNILHTGDAFVKGQYPFIDSRNGGTVEGYRNGLEQILSYCDKNTKIIPGHGNIANMNDVRDFMRMMSIAWQNVVKHFLDGKSEAEIVSMRSFMKEFDDKGYGEQFITREQFLRSIYKEVAVKNDTGEYIRKQELILRLKKEQGGGE
jgi:glyoxylase-like metal-dependent hydrolase (beta-lactamase superfamily II)